MLMCIVGYFVVAFIMFLVLSYVQKQDDYCWFRSILNMFFSLFWVVYVPFFALVWIFGLIAKLVRKLP